MGMTCFREREAWKAAHAPTPEVHRTTESSPLRERFGLTRQMRRAAASIGADIAEGFKRRSWPEKARFYNISEASTAELQNYLFVSRDLGFLKDFDRRMAGAERVGRLLTGRVQSTLAHPS